LRIWGYFYPQHKTAFIGLLCAAFLGYSMMSFKQSKVWENGEALWSHVIKYYPGTDMPWGNRANYQRAKGNYKAALEYYSKAYEIRPNKAEIHNSLGKTYFDLPNSTTREVQKAIDFYTKGIALDPKIGEIYINRGAAYGRMSMETNNRALLQNALQDIEMGKKMMKENKQPEKQSVLINSYLNGYLVHDQLNMTNEALVDVEEYIKYRPNESDMYYSRGLLKRKLNKEQEALQDFDIAIRMGSDNPQNMGVFYYERAKVHAALGNKPQGRSDIQQAQRLGVTVEPALIQTLQ
jgi:tetratricopeptide (TPR) repeat protein